MEMEIKKSGRASLIDLSDIIGVDLYHVERQAQKIVSDDSGLMLINGEIISQSYWDSVAEEINEKLQECSQISLAEIAAQLHIGSELVVSVLEPRLGTLVSGLFNFARYFFSSFFFVADYTMLMFLVYTMIFKHASQYYDQPEVSC